VRSGPIPIGMSGRRKHVCFGSTHRLHSDLLRGDALFLSLELYSRILTADANGKQKSAQYQFAHHFAEGDDKRRAAEKNFRFASMRIAALLASSGTVARVGSRWPR